MNNNNFKKIQILGNTQVSGYFAYCRIVNYDNMTQTKTIKSLSKGGILGYFPSNVQTPFINMVHYNDLIGKINIGFWLQALAKRDGVSEHGLYLYTFTSWPYMVYGIPYDYNGIVYFTGSNFRFIDSTNKSYKYYVLGWGSSRLYIELDKLDFYLPILSGTDYFSVAYVDFCISTNVPLVMEYLGEIEVMQSDNKTNVNNSFFMINRYDENPI